MNNNTFIVANPHKCIGCKACEIACAVAHLDTTAATAGTFETPFLPRLNLVRSSLVTMPIQCRQCDDAPCANVCPTRAITQLDKAIVVNTALCIGCKTCMVACPFGAMDMVPERVNSESVQQQGLKTITNGELMTKENLVAHKCDLCAGRKGGPACVEICPASAFSIVEPALLKDSIRNKRISSAKEMAGSKNKTKPASS
jgi:electron transport protein HydN